jgi:hypothetical protein
MTIQDLKQVIDNAVKAEERQFNKLVFPDIKVSDEGRIQKIQWITEFRELNNTNPPNVPYASIGLKEAKELYEAIFETKRD